MGDLYINGWQKAMERNRKLHDYSPAMQKLFDMAGGYLTYAEKYAAAGGTAVFVMGLWQALIYACNAIPIPYTEIWTRDIYKAVDLAENYYDVPAETCSMVKASLGDWHMRVGGPIKKLFGMGSSCEPYNMALELLRNEGYEVFVMDSVFRASKADGGRYELLLDFFIKQIQAFAEFLTDGQPVDEQRLSYEIKRRNKILRKYQYIIKERFRLPFYVKSFGIMCLQDGVTSYFGRPGAFEAIMDELIAEMDNCPTNTADLERVIPLVWAGGWGQNSGILEVLDDSNAAILGAVSAMSKLYNEELPPLESLARFVLDGQTAGAVMYLRQSIEEHLKQANGQGIVLYGFTGCSLETVSRELNKKYFQEKGVPCISLEGTFQPDLSIGQTQTRVRAFLELLEQKKRKSNAEV